MKFRHLLLVLFLLISASSLAAQSSDTIVLKLHSREIVLSGFTRAYSELTIASEVSGRCESMFVDKGDVVMSPGIIAKFDNTFVLLELEKNKIVRDQATRQLELENRTVERYTRLIEKQSAAITTLEEASLRADINRLTLESLKNEERRLQELNNRHTLYGQVGWQVVERLVEAGEFVSPGQSIVRLGDFRKLLVSIFLTYDELRLLENKEKVDLYFVELNTEISGQVYRISPEFDEVSKKIAVDLLVDRVSSEFSAELRSGMYVQLKMNKRESDIFVAPYQALVSRYDSYWLVTPEKKMMKVVLLGTSRNGQEAIISGDKLVSGGVFLASPDNGIQ